MQRMSKIEERMGEKGALKNIKKFKKRKLKKRKYSLTGWNELHGLIFGR